MTADRSQGRDIRPAHELSALELVTRIRLRADRIDRLGSSHSNTARALAKDALFLVALFERLAVPRDC